MRRPLTCLLTAATAVAAVASTTLAAPTSQAAAPLTYVALGDSYTAASGVLPPDPTARPSACGRPSTTRT